MHKSVLVLGAGSVGKRHLKNFDDLGCVVSAFDPREDRLHEAAGIVNLQDSYSFLTDVDWSKVDGAVIASPPSFHIEQCALLLEQGKHILLEKPVSPTLAEAESFLAKLEQSQVKLLLGYTYRWFTPVIEFRRRLEQEAVGTIYSCNFTMSAHLEDWHPWEKYTDFFMAHRELGGGALLDESHFLDLMLWFFGMPKSVFGKVAKISDLNISTDDNVDLVFEYEDGKMVTVHLDLYGRPHQKRITVVGSDGTLTWDAQTNVIQQSNAMDGDWDAHQIEAERNEMFVNLAEEFLQVMAGDCEPGCTLKDGLTVLHLIERIRESSQSGIRLDL
ncbi:MAG: Gfo/Idh/MocA family oxidoreductase [Pseudomonadales bacterium]|nr:Gfo/Idh/MocA family oxidoreductase [Pseudomonadales bacterium]MBO7004795.1 Gfo/Idh/MocA family oxidoreductase [Pseudomonadales bacterium]